jgi:hypothetical protein
VIACRIHSHEWAQILSTVGLLHARSLALGRQHHFGEPRALTAHASLVQVSDARLWKVATALYSCLEVAVVRPHILLGRSNGKVRLKALSFSATEVVAVALNEFGQPCVGRKRDGDLALVGTHFDR